jgi:hypothetical protein
MIFIFLNNEILIEINFVEVVKVYLILENFILNYFSWI